MGAIAGIVLTDGRTVAKASLEQMLATLKHRGNGPAECWIDGSTGLGARANGFGPARRASEAPYLHSGRVIAIADARIDNRIELISDLRLHSLPDSEISDTQLILAAYEKWGEECPVKILGDFAFAIWDGERRRLFCARDAFGLRPFYYHHRPGLFAFASEIKGLLAVPGVPRGIDEARVLQYLAAYLEDQESTFYEGVRKLPPAHCMTVNAHGVALRRYWSPDPSRDSRLGSDREYVEAFREIFQEAVQCRMRGAANLGSTLSGGLDSSSIACLIRRLRGSSSSTPLNTFSIIFDDVPKSDERRYMDAVVSGGGVRPHFVHGDRIGPLFEIETMLREQDEPFLAPNLFLHEAMYRAARAAGVDVLLDGLDGDTTVSHGVARLTELAAAGRWLTLWSEASAAKMHSDGLSRNALLKGAVAPLIPERVWSLRPGRRKSQSAIDALAATLNPDFRKRAGFDERMREFRANDAAPRTERQHHCRRLTTGLISHCMEVADRASAFCSVEARYPFFDRRLVEFCLSLPSDQKLRSGWTRWILREAMDGVLPPEIQWRAGKADLGFNFLHTLRAFDGERLREALEDGADRLSPYIQPDAAQTALARITNETTWEAAAPALRMSLLSLWLRDANVR